MMDARSLLRCRPSPLASAAPTSSDLPSPVLSRRWQLGAFDEAIRANELDAGYVLGSGLPMYASWLIGTMLGHAFGSVIATPERFGLDFMLVAFSMAFAIDFCKARADILPAVAALAVAILCNHMAPSGWTIMAAGLAGATVTFFLRRDPER